MSNPWEPPGQPDTGPPQPPAPDETPSEAGRTTEALPQPEPGPGGSGHPPAPATGPQHAGGGAGGFAAPTIPNPPPYGGGYAGGPPAGAPYPGGPPAGPPSGGAYPGAAYPGGPGAAYPGGYAGGPPSGSAPQGYQPYGWYQPYAASPPASGATTITASVIQLVQSLLWLLIGIVLVVASRDLRNFFDTTQLDPETRSQARGVIVASGVLSVVVAVAMLTLAVLTLRRINGCRIASGVAQIVLGILLLVGVVRAAQAGDGVSATTALVLTVSCAVAATLFLLSSSARYCQRGAPRPPGY